jgi:hypothetical protein
MKIIGAGMAGLIAAHMLRRHEPVIWEAQPSLPNNHNALLRFRSDVVSKATGIPFKKVTVQKAICLDGEIIDKPNIRLANMYSQKVTGTGMARSILKLDTVERFIAPPDFISQLSKGLRIEYGCQVKGEGWIDAGADHPIISTIPMPYLMTMLSWNEHTEFNYRTIHTVSATLTAPIDLYQTLYYPGIEHQWYRASITGNLIQLEMMDCHESRFQAELPSTCIEIALSHFGLKSGFEDAKTTTQKYGKISPIDNNVRKQFILWASDQFNIYSLGRFATWRQLLLDDLVQDVQIIDNFITQRDAYSTKLAQR